jgi:hypothetical protein
LASKFGKVAKKNIRAAKDFVRNFQHKIKNAMDEEEQLMANAVKKRTKDMMKNTPTGLRTLHLTHGQEEMLFFQRQNDMLQEKGLPYFIRMPRQLGTDQYLWIETTFDSSEFITSLELSHATPGNELNRSAELERTGEYQVIKHEKMKLEVWIERDATKTKGIDGLQVTQTEQEEVRAGVEGWHKIEEPLSLYGVSGEGVHLWFRKIEKARSDGIPTAAGDTNALITEAMKSTLAALYFSSFLFLLDSSAVLRRLDCLPDI